MASEAMAGHEALMRRALELAARGLGRTSPNPAVGAVVVRDGEVVGEGYHHRAGEPHAEPLALAAAGERARGADLYVTLEPCCHVGRTPPCTEAIIAAGIARVWYACADPDPRCAGGGEARLREAGVKVTLGPLTGEATELNRAYFRHKRTGRPFVALKLALTLDGRIATSTGDSRWITGEAARRRVHEWRNQYDAVMVGLGTVLHDDPALTCRLEGVEGRDPVRVILDSAARTPVTARAITEGGARCLISVAEAAPEDRVAALQQAGAEVLRLPGCCRAGACTPPDPGATSGGVQAPALPTVAGGVQAPALPAVAGGVQAPALQTGSGLGIDYGALLDALGQRDIMGVLCEGGATVASRMLRAGAIDEALLFYAPKMVGADGRSAVGCLDIAKMADALQWRMIDTERLGDDLLVTCRPEA